MNANYHNNLRIFFEKELILFSDFDVAAFFFHLIRFWRFLASSFLHEEAEELLVLIKERKILVESAELPCIDDLCERLNLLLVRQHSKPSKRQFIHLKFGKSITNLLFAYLRLAPWVFGNRSNTLATLRRLSVGC